MRFKFSCLLAVFCFVGLSACSDVDYRLEQGDILIEAGEGTNQSSTAGNLMATAIKEHYNLDIVLYPRPLISSTQFGVMKHDNSLDSFGVNKIMGLYPLYNDQDQFKIGTMRGSEIKKLVFNRSREFYGFEVEVAGLEYHIHFVGGYPQFKYASRANNIPLNDKDLYRVAISETFFFTGAFPGYKYRNNLNFGFNDTGKIVSAQAALKKYLEANKYYPALREVRGKVTTEILGHAGFLKIPEIQGEGHRSPVFGHTVTTRGVVTAAASAQWYPGGFDIYIQNPVPDGNPRTSEGLKVHIRDESRRYDIGDYIEVSGVVYEELTNTDLGVTSIREVSSIKLLSKNFPLPEPVLLGKGGRAIPTQFISTYRGNLNLKPKLNLADGIDFWESLEGMRIKINNPRVTDFRGGMTDYEDLRPKDYLNLYVRVDGESRVSQSTPANGMILHEEKNDYNPELVQIVMSHLSSSLVEDDGKLSNFNISERAFKVGDLIEGSLEGVLVYEKNLFGDGEYSMVLPESQVALREFARAAPKDSKELIDRGVSSLTADNNQLLVATFNVENLAGYQDRRLRKLGESLKVNLNCPDIINFVEIQDENGQDFEGDSSAEVTLAKVIQYTPCADKKYEAINIDPIMHAEGGQPGGNIRMAMIYDVNKVGFQRKSNPNPLAETILDRQGNLSSNPGRVFPNADVFEGTRRSLIAQFSFKGQPIFIIGNHFNSKLGDTSRWHAVQPPELKSDNERSLIADKINDFVELLTIRNPQAHILVMGDFNALATEGSMLVLEGEHLKNMVKELVPRNDRYTTTHNGSSQSLDYIFANGKMMLRDAKVEIVHFNSDFMGRLSDHDPVVARFQF